MPETGSQSSEAWATREELHATLGSGNSSAPLLDPDFQLVDEAGAVWTGPEAAGKLDGAWFAADRRGEFKDYGTVLLITDRRRSPGAEMVAVEVWAKRPEGWRLLVYQLNRLADPENPPAHPHMPERAADAPPAVCANPCDFVPYDAKSEAERAIIKSFQTLENAVIRNDAEEWVNHMADEFIVFRTNQRPTTKAQRADALRRQKKINAEIYVAEVEKMRLWEFGDAAVMRADHIMPGNRRPPYRATRVWVKRDGRWQMAISQQTNRPA